MKEYILSIDQGTTSTKLVLYDLESNEMVKIIKPIQIITPKRNWVEHSPEKIFLSIVNGIKDIFNNFDVSPKEIVGIAIDNQGETIIPFNKTTLEPLYNAIVWQDNRTSDDINSYTNPEIENYIEKTTGLFMDPYFSAPKMKWLIDNISGVDLKKANALIDRETQAIIASGDKELPRLQSSGAIANDFKNFLENSEASKKYNAEMVRKIKTEFSEKKLFFMTATPIPVDPELIDVGDEAIQRVIKNPSSSRLRGWTMSFYDPAKDITHTFDGIEKQLGELRLRLFRNGYLDFCAVVSDSFSWGMEDKGKEAILFNPYSITEYPVSFFRLLRELTTIVDGLNSFHVAMGFVNCGEYSLRPYGINTYGHRFGMEENKRSLDDWYFEKSFQALVREDDSDAFIFSERIYNTFSYSRDKIPYFNGEKVFEAKE